MIWLVFALHAQEPDATPPDEEAMWAAWQAGQQLTARRYAEAVLAADADNLPAHVVVGGVAYREDGNLPVARYHLQRAVSLWDWWGDPSETRQWQAHARALTLLAEVSAAMDDREGQLGWMDAHDEAYNPPHVAERAWGLMKLGDWAQARGIVEAGLSSDDVNQRSYAHNAGCAIEGEQGNRVAYFDACVAALNYEQDQGSDLAVAAHNATLAMMAAGRFADAEVTARLGLTSSGLDVSNPWQQLAGIYLGAGRAADAIEAVREMQRWRTRQPAHLRDQSRAELDATYARVLWVAGYPDKALEVVDRSLRFPDRMGFASGSSDQELGTNTLLRRSIRRAAWERERERAVTSPWWRRAWVAVRSWLPDAADRADAATVRSIVATPERARGLFRPYLFDGLGGVLPWWWGDLIDVVGAGVARASLASARAADPEDVWVPFFDALEAEIAWREGDPGEALRLGAPAYAALPDSQVLLRARLAAVLGDAAWSAGSEEAGAWFERALRADPGVLRRLQIRLPATVSGSEAVARSPRLRSGGLFRVEVSADRACLRTAAGNEIGCATPDAEDAEGRTGEEAVAEAFHRHLFALPIRLSRHDRDSLDGSTIAVGEAAAKRLDAALRQEP